MLGETILIRSMSYVVTKLLVGWPSIKRHHGELWHVIDETEWYCSHPVETKESKDVTVAERARTMSLCSSHSVSFAGATSTPCRNTDTAEATEATGATGTTPSFWETDSQPYSLEGSSIQFDSDSDHSFQDADRSRRSYTLPPCSQPPMESVIHFRSLSESHYQPSVELSGGSSFPTKETRIWSRLRTSLRLPKSKRFNGFSLPRRKSKSTTPVVQVNDPALNETVMAVEFDDDPSSDEYQLNRLSSITNPLKPVAYRKRSLNPSSYWTSCYIGLSLPLRISQFHSTVEQFESHPNDSADSAFYAINEEAQFEHATAQCLLRYRHLDSTFKPPNTGNLIF